MSNFAGDDRTERVKPYPLRNHVWPSFLELSFANFEAALVPYVRSFAHILVSSTVFFASSHSSTYISCCKRRRRLERRRTPSMLSFWDHSWCVQSVPAVPQLGGVAANHSSLSDPLNCLATHLLRYLVPLSMSTPSCFQGRLACPLPALSNRHFIEHVHFVVILHLKLPGFLDLLRVQRLSSVIVPCLIEQIIV